MKKSISLVFALLSLFSFSTTAQQIKKCITEEKMQELFSRDPQAKLRYENTRRQLDDKVRQLMNDPAARLFKTAAIINIPVVVHIALPDPTVVTDAVVQRQLDTLNWYYGGAPAGDSMRVYEPFRTSYARSQIRFCLAKRTPANAATTGIVRIINNTDFSSDPSHPSTVAPAWNTQNYLNMWVVNFGMSGTLGFSYKPGTWPPGHQNIGYVVDYRAFGSGPGEGSGGYHYESFNEGKTAVHEIGHYFNLDHTWGPNNNGNPTCTLTDGCADTPPTDGPNFGCTDFPPILDNCSPAAPGVMWQNHMDYADDRCMLLFTHNQVTRMEAALNSSADRNTLLISNGCEALTPEPNDAGISAILTPANGGFVCASTVNPVVTLKNFGSATLTTVTITLNLNGTPQTPFVWTGSLASGTSTSVNLPAINLATGLNSLTVSTTLPNGVADGNNANNAATSSVTFLPTVTMPVTEGFEAAGFPPSGWASINYNGDPSQWQRKNIGRNSSGSMWIDNFTDDYTDHIDDFRSSAISTTGATTMNISFDLAHKYFANPDFYDTLSVLVSNNCGASFQTVYKKWGPALATAGAGATNYLTPELADWRSELISISGALLSNPNVIVVFRNTSRWGNNIYIDNINIQKQSQRDIRLVSINNPGTTACSPLITPTVTVLNSGAETITGFEVGYRIDNGAIVTSTFTSQNLAPGASVTVALNQSAAMSSGNRNITAFTFNPTSSGGSGDIITTNDTLSKTFSVVNLVNPPLTEGFEVFFPPAGWQINNPDGANTWIRKQPGRNSNNAAFIDNYTNVSHNETDDLRSPFINVANADSLIIRFDLAHKNYPNPNYFDTLSVLVSTDCGNTFTSVYKKWGNELSTSGSSSTPFNFANAADWRNERVAIGGTLLANGSISVMIRNTNREGNNVFIDNINIASLFDRDIAIQAIAQPAAIVCNGEVIPSVTIRNAGTETVSSVKIVYSIDNGALQTGTFNGLNLQREATATLNLAAASINASGAHTIKVYSIDPVSISGTGDHYLFNDTLTKTFYIAGSVEAPLVEAFTGTTFPPANWSVVNPDGGITWNRHENGNVTPGSAYVNTFNYNVTSQKDDLVTPNVNYTGVDSVKLRFDVAAAIFSYPGSPAIPMDTLEVLVSKDCGNTFTSVYKKWGDELQTVIIPSSAPVEFFPTTAAHWRNETIDLTGFGGTGPVMVFFRTTNHFENNIFIDNVNLSTRVLPDQLKQQGYLVLPSPFTNSFSVWHIQPPTDLKYINVYNAAGQLVYQKNFNGNALNVQDINLTGKAAGVYIIKLGYNDREVTDRVIKL